ncbi:Sensory transduction histidine kinases [Rubrivivax sp. A210]|uniref:XrtA/PEP-CTERM system histidine kinase PrsK n=1 Tax=Rubrivivax sp. A210 TaxID=2772301 RepID=UPI00191B73B7|nr:XrtA/PEP-CTERM system histidine kinase PrsK [Rubrivivax sp. A210]CAD5375191.1 Sensory transduction histidine kinases [Rubrivivax sp. A210]
MTDRAADLSIYGYALAALVHLAFAGYVLVSGRFRHPGKRIRTLFVAALLASGSWAAATVLDAFSRSTGWLLAAALLDLARYGLWFAFLLLLALPARRPGPRAESAWLAWAAATLPLAGLGLLLTRAMAQEVDAPPSRLMLGVALALPVLGLVLLEQLFRNLGDDSRWNAKPVCLGLACIFAFDVYLYSEALLFGRFDDDALAVRGAVHLLSVPFLFVAAKRRADWIAKMQVSRTAAFYSATLLLAGLYLLFMSAIGYYVRFFGGDWGRALQMSLLVAGLAFLAALMVSGSLRSWLRVFVGKHFFSYRYDYREEWLRFTAMLSSKSSPQEVGVQVVQGLANMVECPGGSLWARGAGEDRYSQAARWNMPAVEEHEAADSSFTVFLRDKGWVIDLAEFRNAPRHYGELALPTWLLGTPNAWLVVPLHVGDELLGFVLLARPRTAMELDWEVRDLLKTAGRQAASFLAQMQATEALLEARKFEAFNRMSAFVVHDLKNIVTQLSLMLKNAQRLRDNPEFQEDMLLTVESSLEKMRRLMLQLREGATPPGGSRGVELAPIVRRLQDTARAQGRALEADTVERLSTRGHDDRLERVLGHLVQNAFDATPATGRVWLSVQRYSGQVKVEVGDTGAGMSEEFVQKRLFRPFNTTKHSGMGIGTYESFQYIRELGGSISVASQPGQGTVVTVLMPLFEAQHGSDLLRAEAGSTR